MLRLLPKFGSVIVLGQELRSGHWLPTSVWMLGGRSGSGYSGCGIAPFLVSVSIMYAAGELNTKSDMQDSVISLFWRF